ncbi:MAG TPA: hypothetical protein VIN08_05635 [Ohtaekwangia sp.]|uniref:hypothetical protein n=1 Tax=Ohtaekwangia sp. TaxID=2066019 RepID=UPI002F9563DE
MLHSKAELEKLISEKMQVNELPYVAIHWEVSEATPGNDTRACYSNYYNGYILPDLPIKPITSPFEFS